MLFWSACMKRRRKPITACFNEAHRSAISFGCPPPSAHALRRQHHEAGLTAPSDLKSELLARRIRCDNDQLAIPRPKCDLARNVPVASTFHPNASPGNEFHELPIDVIVD